MSDSDDDCNVSIDQVGPLKKEIDSDDEEKPVMRRRRCAWKVIESREKKMTN